MASPPNVLVAALPIDASAVNYVATITGSSFLVYAASVLVFSAFHLTDTGVQLASAMMALVGAVVVAVITNRRKRNDDNELVSLLKDENAYLRTQLEEARQRRSG